MGTLYYGDNLDILLRYIKAETIDLVYLDPPFNSAQTYNAFFHEKDGTEAASQIRAFEDTWRWNQESQRVYESLVMDPGKVSEVMQAFRTFLGTNDMMAYLAMMAPRLVELRRVLKSTGSLYLHCDPTASHYLKLLCDAVFGPGGFRNEIIWKRTTAKSLAFRNLPNNHDTLLLFSKTDDFVWNPPFKPYDLTNLDEKAASKYCYKDNDGRRYTLGDLNNPNPDRPNLTYEFLGHKKVWRWTRERMEAAYKAGLVVQPSPGAVPRAKRYLDEQEGRPLDDIWEDIPPLNSQARERLGYPTQKPLALLERIVKASTNPGDMVLDPFCGCGTTIDAAEKLGREWIGIDITQLAMTLIKKRLHDTYSAGDHKIQIKTIGEPVTPADAVQLAEEDKFQFQWWALGLVDARPEEQKKGADHGIDGKILFRDDPNAAKPEQIIIQVKGGKTGVKDVRDLRGVLDREKAAIGVLISLQPPTKEMVAEAVSTGFYEHKTNAKKYPKLQLRSVKELMSGKGIDRPSTVAALDETFRKAPGSKKKNTEQKEFGL
jgi:DNA modification methylase